MAHLKWDAKKRNDNRDRTEKDAENDVSDRTSGVMLYPVGNGVGALRSESASYTQASGNGRLHSCQREIVRRPSSRKGESHKKTPVTMAKGMVSEWSGNSM